MALILATPAFVSVPAHAAILAATAANLSSVFASASGGDTIKLSGRFGTLGLSNRAFTSTVTMDATNAQFTDTLAISDVSRLTVLGGTFGSSTGATRTGRAVGIYNSNNVTFSKSFFVGNGTGVGITTAGAANINVSADNFRNLKLGIGVTSSNDVCISSGRFIGMTSDGINIADSHRVTATGNRCSGTAPAVGAHPDCIQLWSVLGNAVQSDIMLTRNIVSGATQGLTSFNPDNGGGLRISMIGNTISTSFPQGIACYACVDSVFTGNKLTTLPGAQWRTSINIVGGGNNIIANNTVGARPALALMAFDDGINANAPAPYESSLYDQESLPDFVTEDLAYLAANPFGDDDSGLDGAASRMETSGPMLSARGISASVAAVPEPAIWAQLIFGFALTGAALRRPNGEAHRR